MFPCTVVNFSETRSRSVRERASVGLRSDWLNAESAVGRTRFRVGKWPLWGYVRFKSKPHRCVLRAESSVCVGIDPAWVDCSVRKRNILLAEEVEHVLVEAYENWVRLYHIDLPSKESVRSALELRLRAQGHDTDDRQVLDSGL